MDFAQGNFGREKLLAYIRHLQNQGYAPNTIRRFDLTAIRRFYKVNGLTWPLKPWELPQVSERDIYAPALDMKVIVQMIRAAKSGSVLSQDIALLALATIYGLRRIEMTTLSSDDLDLAHHLLHVKTAKHGRERWHLIPEVIAPYPEAGLVQTLSPRQATEAYYRIEAAAGLERMPEVGWHAIRRSLTRALIETGLPEPTIRNFLRWKRSSSDMLLLYQATTVVGADGSRTDPGRQDRAVDEQVFEIHPFLKVWGE